MVEILGNYADPGMEIEIALRKHELPFEFSRESLAEAKKLPDAVRKGDWKYVKIGGKEHLFNLAEDERERADRGRAHPEKLDELKRLWDDWNRQMVPYRVDGFSQESVEKIGGTSSPVNSLRASLDLPMPTPM